MKWIWKLLEHLRLMPRIRKNLRISDQVRRALACCGQTHAGISKATGIRESVLSRFDCGVDIPMESLDTLAEHLNLNLTMGDDPPRKMYCKMRMANHD